MSRSIFVVVASIYLVISGLSNTAVAQQTWPMYQANAAHTGYIPVTFDPSGFTLKWEIQLAVDGYGVHPVAAANGRVFASLKFSGGLGIDNLYAINSTNGSIIWSKNYGDVDSINPPAVEGNVVYSQVGNYTNSLLYGHSVSNGAEVYEGSFVTIHGEFLAPTPYGGRVFISAGQQYGGMYCFDFHEEPPEQWFVELADMEETTPAVDGSFAYAYTGWENSDLAIVEILTGIEIATIPVSEAGLGGKNIAPVLGGNTDVIVVQDDGSGTGRLISFNIGNKTIRYEIDDRFQGQASVRNGVIYVFNDNNLEARDQTTGALLWSWNTDGLLFLLDTMIVTDAHVLLHAKVRLNGMHSTRAIDLATHEEVWSYPEGGYLAFSEGILYIAGDNYDCRLTALQSEAGQVDAQLQLSASAYSASEDSGTVSVTVTRSAGIDGEVGVTISTADGSATAGEDYVAHNEILTWADQDATPRTVVLTLIDDSLEEQPETFTVSLSTPTGDAVLGTNNTATVTIIDDETSTLQISPPSYNVSEEGGTLDVYVTRIGGTNGVVGVTINTANGTATSGQDFLAHSETLDWGVGDATARTITLTIINDAFEEGPEYFNVNLSNPTGPAYLGASSSASITIVDDDLVEVSVNETFLGTQQNSAVHRNSNGDTVIVWQSYDQDGSLWDVYGRLFDSAGDPIDSEFLVNQTTADNQKNPDVAVDTDGSFVVVWQSDNEDGSGTGIFGRCFTASGNPEGTQFQVNSTTPLNQTAPTVAIDPNGSFLVVYQTSNNVGGTGEDLLARGFNANCTPLGSEFPVNATAADDQVDPEVAANGNNSFVVVWQSFGQDGPAEGIITRRFNASGGALNSETVVNFYTSGNQEAPAVDCASDGRCLVAWMDANNRDGDGYSIQAHTLNSTGAPTGSDQRINTYFVSDQTQPAVAVSDDGHAIIAWESDGQDGSGAGVYCQELDVLLSFEGEEFNANLFTWSSQYDPAVTRSGLFSVITWTSGYQDGDSDGIFGRFIGDNSTIFKDGFESGDTNAWN